MINLKSILLLNSASCLAFGVVFVAIPKLTATFLGAPPIWFITTVGAVLILNGMHLFWTSSRDQISLLEIYYFVVGDFVWVALSFVLISQGIFITTDTGVMAASIVALGVGLLGIGQLLAAPRRRRAM